VTGWAGSAGAWARVAAVQIVKANITLL